MKTAGGYLFQMFLNLKKRRKEHTQLKNTAKLVTDNGVCEKL